MTLLNTHRKREIKMRIQLASDLHIEHLSRRFPGQSLIGQAPGADVLVLAGDIANACDAIKLFGDWPVPVLYVMGNHEGYDECIDDVRDGFAAAARGTSVRLLERDVADFGGVRFLGCTLWTDYRLISGRTQSQLMENAERNINDHRRIRSRSGELFSPKHALRDHVFSRAWLDKELSKNYDGKTVVVTHHAPHPLSVHPRYAGDPTNAAFASDLRDLLQHADVWLHGHVHDSFDYVVSGCRVVANPRGYPLDRDAPARELRFENAAFKESCVIDI
jgi:Icc-related predicted phosphoesterase